MVANVSCGGDQYAHTINTLKYADRAKEIKTHVVQNLQTVESHISEYQRLIDNLQGEVAQLNPELRRRSGGAQGRRRAAATRRRSAAARARAADVPRAAGAAANPQQNDNNRWLDRLCVELRENAEDRVDVQRALYEHEDDNIQNKCEMRALDDRMAELSVDPDAWGVGVLERTRFATVASRWCGPSPKTRRRVFGTERRWTSTSGKATRFAPRWTPPRRKVSVRRVWRAR